MLYEQVEDAEPTTDIERHDEEWIDAFEEALETLPDRVTLRLLEDNHRDIAAFMADRGIEGPTEALRLLVDLGLTNAALENSEEWMDYPSLRGSNLSQTAVSCAECGTTDPRLIRVITKQVKHRKHVTPYDPTDTELVCANCGRTALMESFMATSE